MMREVGGSPSPVAFRGGLKARVSLAAGAVAVLALLAYGTLSFTAAVGSAEGEIVAGRVDIELSQTDGQGLSGFPAGALELKPGETLSQTLAVRNAGEHPVYVRVQLVPSVEGSGAPADGLLALSGTGGAWSEQGGFWYYGAALGPGESTEPLFTGVSLASAAAPADDRTVQLRIKALSVQSENNGADPRAAAGWPTL